MQTLLVLLVGSLLSTSALAWGERGHQLIGKLSANLTGDLTAQGATPEYKRAFADRSHPLGHVSNLPDTSSRNKAEFPRIYKMNNPMHWFHPEAILGAPGTDYAGFARRYRELPVSYDEYKAKVEGKPSQIPGIPEPYQSFERMYESVGVTPWRAQQLFDLMVSALRCLKSKDGQVESAEAAAKPMPSPFRVPADGGMTGEIPLPTYVCQPALPRRSDTYAAFFFAGQISHFIGDHGQPYHPTADYDGYATGNGKIHSYFESLVVQEIDLGLDADVWRLATSPAFARRTWAELGTDLAVPNGVVRLLHYLGADSFAHMPEVMALDDRYAMIEKSTVYPFGANPHTLKIPGAREAKRKPSNDPQVQAAFRPLIVRRMATSVVLLARTWLEAWKLAGKPLLDVSQFATPYPLDPPFVWPDFDLEALARLKPSTAPAPAIRDVCEH